MAMGDSFQLYSAQLPESVFYTAEGKEDRKPRSGESMQPTAQAVGKEMEQKQALEGRKKLAPNVSFVALNLVLLEERYILLLEGHPLVVLFLHRNVSGNRGHI
ncbi:MAG: hypothetical protein WA474_03145 [Candidatus Sulfotelmatobacter sp.]